MTRNVARYAVTFGLAGLYMPNSHDGAHEFTTRRELANYIRDALQMYGLPSSLFGQVHIRRLWGFIVRNGSSVAHFSLTHGDNELAFHGLTEEEYTRMSAENDQ
jgi:hypothetical protein